ncbi:MAG: hypothetical protein HHJ19_11100 [Polaromonas sp.]|nr:hypothetical protein [Polaromonas sp.]
MLQPSLRLEDQKSSLPLSTREFPALAVTKASQRWPFRVSEGSCEQPVGFSGDTQECAPPGVFVS